MRYADFYLKDKSSWTTLVVRDSWYIPFVYRQDTGAKTYFAEPHLVLKIMSHGILRTTCTSPVTVTGFVSLTFRGNMLQWHGAGKNVPFFKCHLWLGFWSSCFSCTYVSQAASAGFPLLKSLRQLWPRTILCQPSPESDIDALDGEVVNKATLIYIQSPPRFPLRAHPAQSDARTIVSLLES